MWKIQPYHLLWHMRHVGELDIIVCRVCWRGGWLFASKVTWGFCGCRVWYFPIHILLIVMMWVSCSGVDYSVSRVHNCTLVLLLELPKAIYPSLHICWKPTIYCIQLHISCIFTRWTPVSTWKKGKKQRLWYDYGDREPPLCRQPVHYKVHTA